MKFYIEAYYLDGSPILGNGDGQAVLRCANYRRTKAFADLISPMRPRYPRVAYWQIVTKHGTVVDTIRNTFHEARP